LTNRLRDESSPYLLQHAENPVDWYPWGAAAFTRARELDKPVFLSIGYSACHWCHVMAHESFEDLEAAAMLNEHFVSIKVDREERPDVDALYMDAVVAMAGQGGWPLSVFLTPDGKPFYGGTYFPPSRRHGMPSFKEVLLGVARAWGEERDRLISSAAELVRRISAAPAPGGAGGELRTEVFDQAAERSLRGYDWQDGGWGRAPKFPAALTIEYLLQRHHRTGDMLAREMATHALTSMARGGMYDWLGGGFHRYSVDNHWLIPHFEKMLYDNALLARAYLHGWLVTKDPLFRTVLDETLSFLLREMKDGQGGFYSSLDADSEGEEGRFYLWRHEELKEVLEEDELLEFLVAATGSTEPGNFEGKNILFRALPPEKLAQQFGLSVEASTERLKTGRGLLMQRREQRVRPGCDDKILSAWNGFVLAALADAARSLSDPLLLVHARNLAGFLTKEMIIEGRLMRSWRRGQARVLGYLEDYASLGLGLLELYQADFHPVWFETAFGLGEEILTRFRDSQGGFFDTGSDHESLFRRPKTLQDTPTPSGSALATALFLRLHALTGEPKYLEPAEETLYEMQHACAEHPIAFSAWLSALDFHRPPQWQLAIVGNPQEAAFRLLAGTTAGRYLPRAVIAGGEAGRLPKLQLLEDRAAPDGEPTAFLCQGFACNLPTTSPDELARQLADVR